MQPFKCKLRLWGAPKGCVARPHTTYKTGPEGGVETLIVTSTGQFFPIAYAGKGLALRPSLGIDEEVEAGQLQRYQPGLLVHHTSPCYDPFSRSVFVKVGNAVGRLTADNVLSTVAGHVMEAGRLDGMGGGVRLTDPAFICSNGRGSLYSLSGNVRVAQYKLPASWRAGAEDGGASASAPTGAGEERVQVTTLPCYAASELWGLAYHPSAGPHGALIIATRTALYRLPLNADGSPAAAAPLLLAGREGDTGKADCRGEEARFSGIWGCVVDSQGGVIVADNTEAVGGYRTFVRRVAPDGTVSTLVSSPVPTQAPEGEPTSLQGAAPISFKGRYCRPFILHTGHLCLVGVQDDVIRALDLGLKPCALLCPAFKARAPCGTLHADMGALLDAQPDGTADLTLVVGDRRFPVHRAILIARSPYFRPRLEGGFADGAEAELGLPEADPDAFALVLRWLYTGAVELPAPLAPAVAELADRLLLPELCADAQAVVLSGVSAETVVGSLLWAERLGGSFAPLLAELKAWCAEHGPEVAAVPHSLKRLAESPDLMALLVADLLMGGVKRRRTA